MISSPNPALVTQRAARRLPRLALLLLCAAYLLPGVVGRDPWRNADVTAFGQMVAMAEGRTSWVAPTLGGVAGDAAFVPHWLGAAGIVALSPLVDAALAARLVFMLLLAGTLALTWATTFHLARTEAAQPVPFAFGGEADPVDYARAMADGALLALMATLGLLRLGHETTPELAQLFAVSLFLYALAAAPFRRWQPPVAAVVALAMLAGSGAPTMAALIGVGGAVVCQRSGYEQVRRFVPWLVLAVSLSSAAALGIGAWHWKARVMTRADLLAIATQWAWFLWPVWPLVLWTLWRWRQHILHRHLAVPLVVAITALSSNLAMAGSDRALMLGLPAMAVMAAFALPTLQRSTSAALDWFSVFFFSIGACAIWVIYASMQIGVPAKPAANIARLATGFVPRFSLIELVLGIAGTAAWIALVRWRTGRHREAIWKSLALAAGGVGVMWLLVMTLLLPPLDYALSSRPLVQSITALVPRGQCIAGPGMAPPLVASLEYFGRYAVDARPAALSASNCNHLVLVTRTGPAPPAPAGWAPLAQLKRPTDRDEITAVYRRIDAPR